MIAKSARMQYLTNYFGKLHISLDDNLPPAHPLFPTSAHSQFYSLPLLIVINPCIYTILLLYSAASHFLINCKQTRSIFFANHSAHSAKFVFKSHSQLNYAEANTSSSLFLHSNLIVIARVYPIGPKHDQGFVMVP